MRLGLLIFLVATSAACGSAAGVGTSDAGPMGSLVLHVVAAPTCPVFRPSAGQTCAAAHVSGATIHIGPHTFVSNSRGLVVARLTAGRYLVTGNRANGYPQPPRPETITMT